MEPVEEIKVGGRWGGWLPSCLVGVGGDVLDQHVGFWVGLGVLHDGNKFEPFPLVWRLVLFSRRKSWTILASSWTRVKVAFRILWILGTWQLLLGRQKPEVLNGLGIFWDLGFQVSSFIQIFCLATFVVIPLVNVDFQMLFLNDQQKKSHPHPALCHEHHSWGTDSPPGCWGLHSRQFLDRHLGPFGDFHAKKSRKIS